MSASDKLDTIPEELNQQEEGALKWAAFALFAALAPFIVFLLPKIAGPAILFGVLVFCGLFLLSDQKSNLRKNALALWQNPEQSKNVQLEIDCQKTPSGPQFYILLNSELPPFKTKTFVVNLSSKNAEEMLADRVSSGDRFKVDQAELTLSEDNDEVVLVKIDTHRFWCRPWNYQYDIQDEINQFGEKENTK